MLVRKALIDAYTEAYGKDLVDKEQFRQSNPLSFKAILAVFSNFEAFAEELKEKPVAAPIKEIKK